jgi:hypothetical protein
MASKKKFEGLEVVSTAPRMNKFDEVEYDNATRMGMTPEQYRQKTMDTALGFTGAGVTRAQAQAARKASGYLKSVEALKAKAAANPKSIAGPTTRTGRRTLDTLGQPIGSNKNYYRNVAQSYADEGRNIKPSLDDYDMYAKGGKVKTAKYAKGGKIDGIAQRGKTKGRMR